LSLGLIIGPEAKHEQAAAKNAQEVTAAETDVEVERIVLSVQLVPFGLELEIQILLQNEGCVLVHR
jgi:hypothetical protein